jgi:hypothetical protein
MKGYDHQKGVTLIIVILVLAFLLTIGIAAITVTRTGPAVATNVRHYQEAFNAAEAGFDATWLDLEGSGISSFDGLYLTQPFGIDIPDPDLSSIYFRRLTDEELFELFDSTGVDENTPGMIYYKRQFRQTPEGAPDLSLTYTVFLIDDEVGEGMAPDPNDALLICIGLLDKGGRITTSRLEIVLAFQTEGI